MQVIMMRARLFFRVAMAFLGLFALAASVLAQSDRSAKEALERLNASFKGKTITAKMDLPIIRSVYVTPAGEYDERRYREKLQKQDPSILRGETAELRKIELDGDKVHVLINNGGIPGFAMGRGSRVLSGRKRAGSRIEIEFGRPVTSADLTPDAIVRAVSKIIAIEGAEASVALARPDELLPTSAQSSGASAPGASPPASPAVRAAGETPPATVPGHSVAEVELLSIEVQPTRVRPGERIELVIVVEVRGVSASSALQITEERQLLFNDKPLLTTPLSTTREWRDGRQRTTAALEIPRVAEPGTYTFSAKLRGPGVEAAKEVLFQVVR